MVKGDGVGAGINIEEIKLKFDTQGFVHLQDIMPAPFLDRLRVAFDAAVVQTEHLAAAKASRKGAQPFFDIPRILEADEAFVDLADLDSLFPLLRSLVGDDIQLIETAARLFFPGLTFTAPFHSDLAHVGGFSHAHSLNFLTKVHFYLEDLSADQGCLAFIPGSHRMPADYRKPSSLINEHSDAVVKIVPKAGDAIIFNTHVLHMALDNHSGRVRKSIIYSYSHFWMKQARSAVPPSPSRFSCKQRKQLFGVEEEGVPFFNRTLAEPQRSPYRRVVASGKKMAVQLGLDKLFA